MALVVASAVKKDIRKEKMACAGDLIPALEKEIEALLRKAVARARSNGRKTVRAADL